MECNDIQEKLSAYIEGVASAEEKAVIEEHLKSCQACSTSLKDLEKTMSYIKTLEEMEPPAWLTQKVMTRIREEVEPKEGILHKLFYPLHIKLPVQIVATILIAVSAFFIFKTIQPEIRHSGVAVDEMTEPQVLLKDKEVLSESTKMDERVSPTDEVPKPITTADIPTRDREVDTGTAVPESKIEEALKGKERDRLSPDIKEEVETHEFRKPSLAGPMKQLYHAKQPEAADETEEALKTQEPAEKEAIKTLSGDLTKDESRVEGISVRAGKITGEKEKYPNITLTVDSLENSRRDIEEIVKKIGGKILKIEKFEDKMLIIVACNALKTDELLNKLRPTGEIKEEGFVSEQCEGQGEISIELVEK